MNVSVEFTTDPGRVLREAERYLLAEPVLHNLMLTLLHARVRRPEPVRSWIAKNGDDVRGVVFQSPFDYPASLSRLFPDALTPLVNAIVMEGVALPGANGDADTAARFAEEWAERTKIAARLTRRQRIYEAQGLVAPKPVPGHFRAATRDDRQHLTAWVTAFFAEIGELVAVNPASVVDAKLEDGLLWVWDDHGVGSMAANTLPVAGITRVQYVFTPRTSRARGYASACVFELTRRLLAEGQRCMLFTDLTNPTSNSVYRSIGYHAVAEALQYRFDSHHSADLGAS